VPEPGITVETLFETRPEALNLLTIYAALDDSTVEDVQRTHGGQPFSAFKAALTELAVARLDPISAEMRRLIADPGHVDAVLRDGADRARALAAPVMREVMDVVGLLRP